MLTLRLGAWAFALESRYNKAAKGQQRKEKKVKADLERGFRRKSQIVSHLKTMKLQ